MESPKYHHKKLKPGIHIMFLENGKYGLLGFNNMIPVHNSALIEFNIDDEERQYAELLKRQVRIINEHKSEVYHRASKTYYRATTKEKDNFFRKICCNFKKLEKACDRYDPNHQPRKTK